MGTSNAAIIEACSAGKSLSGPKRQYRSPELKHKMVEKSLAPGASVARIARAYWVNANQSI